MLEKKLRIYELIAANTPDRRERGDHWRWAGVLEKVANGLKGEVQPTTRKWHLRDRGKEKS